MNGKVRIKYLKLYASFVTISVFLQVPFHCEGEELSGEKWIFNYMFQNQTFTRRPGISARVNLKDKWRASCPNGTRSSSNRRIQPLQTVIISVNETSPLTDGRHTLQLADRLIKDTGFFKNEGHVLLKLHPPNGFSRIKLRRHTTAWQKLGTDYGKFDSSKHQYQNDLFV